MNPIKNPIQGCAVGIAAAGSKCFVSAVIDDEPRNDYRIREKTPINICKELDRFLSDYFYIRKDLVKRIQQISNSSSLTSLKFPPLRKKGHNINIIVLLESLQ